MGKLLLFVGIMVVGVKTLMTPYIGAIAYYFIAILGPQYIWWWNFEGLRVSFVIAAATIASFLFAFIQRKTNLTLLNTKINLGVFLLWFMLISSFFLGPYISLMGDEPKEQVLYLNKIVLFYFISVVLLDDLKKIKLFSYVMIISSIYLIYWANYQYLSGNFSAFSHGRLMGPRTIWGTSIYNDENAFAMFFVTGGPFLYFWGQHLAKNSIQKYCAWLLLPLGWHAVFLTGSRGGIVGIAATIGATVFFSKKKLMAVMLIPLLYIAFQWQAGDLLKNRSSTIVDYEGERSAETRLEAWSAAFTMMQKHPITGVGITCFIPGMKVYSVHQSREPHSVPFQYGAEAGILALFAYLFIVFQFFLNSLKINRLLTLYQNRLPPGELESLLYLNEATTVSFLGLFVCSLFLSLNYYEIFYFLLIISGFLRYKVDRIPLTVNDETFDNRQGKN